MNENICHFIPTKNTEEGINILNFVYEKESCFSREYILNASYSLCLVSKGTGILHTAFGTFPLETGQLFFLFSAKPYFIENTGSLHYIYISFIGSRAAKLLNRLDIPKNAPSSCTLLSVQAFGKRRSFRESKRHSQSKTVCGYAFHRQRPESGFSQPQIFLSSQISLFRFSTTCQSPLFSIFVRKTSGTCLIPYRQRDRKYPGTFRYVRL